MTLMLRVSSGRGQLKSLEWNGDALPARVSTFCFGSLVLVMGVKRDVGKFSRVPKAGEKKSQDATPQLSGPSRSDRVECIKEIADLNLTSGVMGLLTGPHLLFSC